MPTEPDPNVRAADRASEDARPAVRRRPRRRAVSSGGAVDPATPDSAAIPVSDAPGAKKRERPTAGAALSTPPSTRAPTEAPAKRGKQRGRPDSSERQWRELAGAGHTRVSLSAALRARNADQPTPGELEEAERTAVVQRRNWVPGTTDKDG